MASDEVVVWYNRRCSKCQAADELFAAYGVPVRRVHYLDDPPSRDEIVRVLGLLPAADPWALMRTSEPRYAELLIPLLQAGGALARAELSGPEN